MKHLDLFSGIGGFALAVDRVWGGSEGATIEHIFCDIDPFCQQVLKKHWPDSKIYGDIRTITDTRSTEPRRVPCQSRQKSKTIGRVDILTGGFPCQPFSNAGQRKGDQDDRFLWPEMLRIIRTFRPTWIIGENVAGIISMALEQVCFDLEAAGYEVQSFIVPAAAVGAPHRRDRVWIVAHHAAGERPRAKNTIQTRGDSFIGTNINASNLVRPGLQREINQSKSRKSGRSLSRHTRQSISWDTNWPKVAAELCGVDDGVPVELDQFKLSKSKHREQRLKALGNAIVPQVAEEIMRIIKNL